MLPYIFNSLNLLLSGYRYDTLALSSKIFFIFIFVDFETLYMTRSF